MKKRILLVALMVALFACLFVFGASAAELDTDGETVTLADSTVLPLWDTDGNALIWYTSTANADDGYANYDYVLAQDTTRVSIEANGSYSAYDSNYNQIRYIKIDGEDGKNSIVVLNLKDDDVKVTGSTANGGLVNGFEYTFDGSTVLEYAYLHESTIAFQKQAFQNCKNLSYVNFTELTNLKQIESNAFWCCYKLFADTTLDLSKTALRKVGTGGIAANSTTEASMMQFTKIIFPSTLTDWGNYPFQYCAKLTTVEGLENTQLASLAYMMFYHCPKLESITLPSTLETIPEYAFAFSNTIKDNTVNFSITIPNSVETIAYRAFQNNTSLVSVTLGTGLKETKVAVFENCSRLDGSVVFPEGFETMRECAFQNCSSLKGVTLPTTLTTMEAKVFAYTGLTSVVGLENTQISSIGNSAFRGAKSWAPDVIQLPNTVTTIDTYGFADVPVKKVVIGANVTAIKNEAFTGCKSMTEFVLPAGLTTIYFNNSTARLFFVTSSDATYLNTINSKVSGTIITYDEYIANPDNYASGKYVISGLNVCDTFYNGIHELDPEQSNTCAGICANCDEPKQSATPEHAYIVEIAYTDLAKTGTKTTTCGNENCAFEKKVEALNAIFTFVGYSSDMATNSYITVGYLIDQDALAVYKSTLADGVAFSYGFVGLAAKADATLNTAPISSTTGEVTGAKMMQVNLSAQQDIEKCTAVDFKIKGDFKNNEAYAKAQLGMALYTSVRTTESGTDTYTINYVVADSENITEQNKNASKSVSDIVPVVYETQFSTQNEEVTE